MFRVFYCLTVLLLLSGTASANALTERVEETDERWSYSGHWRLSTSGQNGSGGNYAVGNASVVSVDSNNALSNEAGFGEACVNLRGYPTDTVLNLTFGFVLNSTTFRSTQVPVTLHFSDGTQIDTLVSQVGVSNTIGTFGLGAQRDVTEVCVSNQNSNDTFSVVDFLDVAVVPDSVEPNFRSTFTMEDIIPQKPLGTTVVRDVTIGTDVFGDTSTIAFSLNFGTYHTVLDDLDENGVPELLVTVEHRDEERKRAEMVILFLDDVGNVLKHQFVDSAMTKDTGFSNDLSPSSLSSAGDFDSNGVKDVVLSFTNTESFQGDIRVLLFGSDNDAIDPSYTVEGQVEISNSVGGLPFVLNEGVSFGLLPRLIGDIDGNGVADFVASASSRLSQVVNVNQSGNVFTSIMLGRDGSAQNIEVGLGNVGSFVQPIGDVNKDGTIDFGTIQSVTTNVLGASIGFVNVDYNRVNNSSIIVETDGVVNRVSEVYPVGDANQDGNIDLIVLGQPDPSNSSSLINFQLLLLDSSFRVIGEPIELLNRFELGSIRTSGLDIITLADMDNDGDLDLVIGAPTPQDSDSVLYIRYFD